MPNSAELPWYLANNRTMNKVCTSHNGGLLLSLGCWKTFVSGKENFFSQLTLSILDLMALWILEASCSSWLFELFIKAHPKVITLQTN